MLLTIDVGNTNITFAIFKNKEIIADWRISTLSNRTSDEYAALLTPLFTEKELEFKQIDGVAISCVVPSTLEALVRFSNKHLQVEKPVVLSHDLKLPMAIKYFPVTDVGADRIANAIAAHAKYGGKIIVVDFGTATTLDAVDEDGNYLGGAIAPGIQISLEALFSRAARLTGVELTSPEKAIGDTTSSSLRSGIIFGFAGQVDALVERFEEEMGKDVTVIATGGLAEIISKYSKKIKYQDDLLTLEGLRLIYENSK